MEANQSKDFKELHYRYLTDRNIQRFNSEIANLHNMAIPTVILNTDEDSFIMIYDKKTNYEVDRIREIQKDYILKNYKDLWQQV